MWPSAGEVQAFLLLRRGLLFRNWHHGNGGVVEERAWRREGRGGEGTWLYIYLRPFGVITRQRTETIYQKNLTSVLLAVTLVLQ